jgi:hypothetical protein
MPQKKRVTRDAATRGVGIRRTFRLYADEWDTLAGISDQRFGGNEHTAVRRALLLLDLVYGVEVELPADLAVLELRGDVPDVDKARAGVLAAAARIAAKAGK